MKRLHLHVSVDDLADSIRFYSGMFAAEPTVQKTDYAKWMLDDPRINFAISRRGVEVGLNHLGIQVESGAELQQMQSRLEALQPGVAKEADVACCYARSDKYWVSDPSGIAWETFHTLADIPVFGAADTDHAGHTGATERAACCIPSPETGVPVKSSCCAPNANAAPARCC